MGGSQSYPPSREVSTKYGPIVGRRMIHEGERCVDAFQGIPYARPPLGDLRFRKPEPPEPWTEVRKCCAFGNRSMQTAALWEKWKHGPISEDSLYLNVFTPCWDPPAGGFAVLLFVHGGGYVSDSTVKYGDMKVSQHLVGLSCLYTVEGQTMIGCPVETGIPWILVDWRFILHRQPGLMGHASSSVVGPVEENIGSFNGNASNVTLMGQSAGGASVDLLSLSPHTRDLFHKVIPMAGNASASWALQDNAVEACREFAIHKLGVSDDCTPEEYMERLRKVPATKYAVGLNTASLDATKTCLQIGPRIDGHLFPRSIDQLRKEARGKHRMVGCCQYEGLIMMMMNKTSTVERFKEVIAAMIPETVDDFKLKRAAMLEELIGEGKGDHVHGMAELLSDIFLNTSCQSSVLEWTEAGDDRVFFYSFDYCNKAAFGPLKYMMPFVAPTHCTELGYIFGVGIVWDFTFNEQDMVMLDRVTALWSNFAKYGDPNGEGDSPVGVRWEAATRDAPQRHLSIGWNSCMKEEYHEGRPMKWIQLKKNEKNK